MDRINICTKPCEKPPIHNTRRFESLPDSPYFPPSNLTENPFVVSTHKPLPASFCIRNWGVMIAWLLMSLICMYWFYKYFK